MEPEEQDIAASPTPSESRYRIGAYPAAPSYPPQRPPLRWTPASQVLASLLVGVIIGMLALGFVASSSLPTMVSLRQSLGLGGGATNVLNSGPTVKQNLTVQESSAVITATKSVLPAVVSVTVNEPVSDYYDQDQYDGDSGGDSSGTQEEAAGSGFIISSDGLIMTNRHVVESESSNPTYQVVLNDGRIFNATVQATDPLNDLAVLKINATNLPTVTLGDSNALQTGQAVLAVGNALGEFSNSVSSGIISAEGRSIAPSSETGTTEQLTDLLQTDAAINPGNSGGPLVNLDGQVVGIDTAIASSSGASDGIGFAIPVDDIKPVIASVLKTGKITVPYLGVRYQAVDSTLQNADNLSVDYGALVSGDTDENEPAVIPGSPAAAAGLQANDIILDVDGTKVDSDNPLQRLLQEYQPGNVVTLTVLRSGKQITVKATLGSQS